MSLVPKRPSATFRVERSYQVDSTTASQFVTSPLVQANVQTEIPTSHPTEMLYGYNINPFDTTPTIDSTTQGTAVITLSSNNIFLGVGAVGDSPVNYLQITVDPIAGPIITTVNGSTLQGNVHGVVDSAMFFTEPLEGDIIGSQDATVIAPGVIVASMISPTAGIENIQLATLTEAGLVANSATTATSANAANAIVARDGSGNFSANTITATLNGSATGFTGSLAGNVTGTQGATVIAPGVITNSMIATGAGIDGTKLATLTTAGLVANSATTATFADTVGAIVARDGSGNFAAGTITANLIGNASTASSTTNFSGSLAGNVTGTQTATVIAPGVITNSMIATGAGIDNTKLATLTATGLVANSATTATSANTANDIGVARDGSGNFAAGTITASLNGNATSATTATTAGSTTNFSGSLAGDITGTQTSTLIANGVITDVMIAAGANIANSKLATLTTAESRG